MVDIAYILRSDRGGLTNSENSSIATTTAQNGGVKIDSRRLVKQPIPRQMMIIMAVRSIVDRMNLSRYCMVRKYIEKRPL